MAGLKLLVVEDDPLIRDELRDLFEAEGYEVAVACHGAEALVRLQTGWCPRIILTDLCMPVMDGWCFLQRLKDHPTWRFIPIVVASADIDPRPGGSTPLLRKPFRAHEVVCAVARQAKTRGMTIPAAVLDGALTGAQLRA